MATIEYPDNINVNGLMSFPIYNQENLEQLKEWRTKKGIKAPKFPDRIGFTLMLNQIQHDAVVKNLLEVYLPFAANLQKISNKEKGIDPKLVAKLSKLVEEQDWSESNLPLRDLSDKDQENLDKNEFEGIVSKIRLNGPPQDGAIKVKSIIKVDGVNKVVDIEDVEDRLGDQTDPDALWFGALWPFRTSVRFNAFNAANFGVSAYVRSTFLLADKELKQFGGGDGDVLEDGDDFE